MIKVILKGYLNGETVKGTEIRNPKLKTVTWIDKVTEKEIKSGRYGKEIHLQIDTEDAMDCWLLVALHCEDWKEPYRTEFIQVGENGKIPSIDNTIYKLVPNAEWLKESTSESNNITAEVYLLHSLYNYRYFTENTKKVILMN